MLENFIETTPLLLAGVFVFGTMIGSFLNVVILRVPPLLDHDWRTQCRELLELEPAAGEKPPGIALSRSRCPNCGHNIRALENVPLISYIALRGRCSSCKARISPRYPFIEALTAIMFVIVIWHFGVNSQGLTSLVLTGFLIALAGIDAEHQLLPDNLTLPLVWAGITVNLFAVHTSLSSSVIGAIAGYLVLWTIYHLFRLLTGKEGMGYGDFKLMAALGAWMGWQMIPLIVLLSSVVGAVAGISMMVTGRMQRENPMPFGPFIAAAGWIALIWGERIMAVYTQTSVFG